MPALRPGGLVQKLSSIPPPATEDILKTGDLEGSFAGLPLSRRYHRRPAIKRLRLLGGVPRGGGRVTLRPAYTSTSATAAEALEPPGSAAQEVQLEPRHVHRVPHREAPAVRRRSRRIVSRPA